MNLTEDELILINKNRAEIIFKKGEILFKQGSLVSQLAYVRSGLVKISMEYGKEELVISLEAGGKFIGIQSLYSGNVVPFTVTACEEVHTCLIDINAIRGLISANTVFASNIIKQFNEDILFAYNRMKCLSLKQINGRFADLLLCFSLRIYKRKSFIVPLSKKEMAVVTNMSQESLSRVVKDFITEKIIEIKGNEYTILDFEKIRHLSMVG